MKKGLRFSVIICLVLAMLCGTVLAEGNFSRSANVKERAASSKMASFLSSPYLYGASDLRISTNGLKARLSWDPDYGSNVSGYVVFQCNRSYYKPSNLPYGWYTLRSDGYYWYPVSLIGTTTSTYMDISANSSGTYYIEVDSYYLSYSSYVSSHGEFATFYASGSSTPSVSAPSTVKASQTANNKVKLTWTAGSGAKSYAVYRATGSGSFTKIATTTKLTYTDKKVKNGKTYKYKIQAINGSQKKYSKVVKAYPMAKPGSVKAKNNGNGTITISWGKVPGAKKYEVYQKAPGSSSFSKVTTTSSRKAKVSASGGGTYKFYVMGAVGSFTGVKSKTVSVTVSGGSPDVPSSAKYRALIVANTYTGGSTLNGTANDARAMQGALEGLSQNWNVTVKRNVDASAILSAISSAFSGADSDDVCLFYYSGHGVTSYGEYSGALCGNSGGNYVTMSELADALDSACPGKVIVLLDSCGSGAGIDKGTGSAAAMTQAAINAFSGKNRMLTSKYGELCGSKFNVLAAASMHTSSYDTTVDGNACGAFTYSLLKAMGCSYPYGSYSYGYMPGDTNDDDALTLRETYNSICKTVSEGGWDAGANQHTQYYGTNNMILFKR